MKLAALFSDHMVLQRGISLPVWGWAEPGSRVTAEIAGNCAQATAGADGKWMARLPALGAGGPHTLAVRSETGEHLIISDVMIGEVWICSGQSNMEFQLYRVKNAAHEILAANDPEIRLFQVPSATSVEPLEEISAQWQLCTSATARNFSAAAYFFARKLRERLKVAVGLVSASWGGTAAEAWTSREGLLAEPELRSLVADYEELLVNPEKQAEYLKRYNAWEDVYEKRPVPPNTGYEQGWASADCKPEGWSPFHIPCLWQRTGLDFSGVLWFRREVEIPAEWAGQDLTLKIGACDKSDWTYFNGEPVGSLLFSDDSNAWFAQRNYIVPGRLVKPGRNVLAVRVFSHINDGGMSGPAEAMTIGPVDSALGSAIPLAGVWNYRVEHHFGVIPKCPPQPPKPGNASWPWTLSAGMIAPLVPYAVRGAIWYQGEANVGSRYSYRTIFGALIRDWRRRWNQERFHFHFVQLANFHAAPDVPRESDWAELREAQMQTLALPDTGMAVTIDIGDANDIHPINKQDVGLRLALSALASTYGEKDVVSSGPLYQSASIEDGKVRIAFDHLGGGLECRDGALTAFAVAGANRKFVWADARIDGDTVVVSSPQIPAPAAVRYGWADNPQCNLYNRAGLPASPFRTDDWNTKA